MQSHETRTSFTFHLPSRFGWLAREVFVASLLSYFVFSTIESLLPGFVSGRLNLNAILWLALLSGIMSALVRPAAVPHHSVQSSRSAVAAVLAISLATGALVAWRTISAGTTLAIAFGLFAAALVAAVGRSVTRGQGEQL